MRIGSAWINNANANYRVVEPLKAMALRGHHIVWAAQEGEVDPRHLGSCDVVHVYRRADDTSRRVLAQLARAGVGIVYDNDDDLRAIPKESPDYKKYGGPMAHRLWAQSIALARLATVVTTTNEPLAEAYRKAGAKRVEVIPNQLAADVGRSRRRHDGIVIGWIGGIDHRADEVRIGISAALRRLTEERDDLRVDSVGVKLRLDRSYTHRSHLPFDRLPGHIGGYDIGIAPLADLPGNRVRSDIKLKEYAASGVPWLASPVGPYRNLGEAQGGRLVADGDWYEALKRLVDDHADRERLSQAGVEWARRNTITSVAHHWEQVFRDAAGPDRGTAVALKPGLVVRLRDPRISA